MNMFQKEDFVSHAGLNLTWKIECDAMTPEDWDTIAYIVSLSYKFSNVRGIPRGGLPFQKALEKYEDSSVLKILIVDDVLTSGESMSEFKDSILKGSRTIWEDKDIQGVVLFSRFPCNLDWVKIIFQLNFPVL